MKPMRKMGAERAEGSDMSHQIYPKIWTVDDGPGRAVPRPKRANFLRPALTGVLLEP